MRKIFVVIIISLCAFWVASCSWINMFNTNSMEEMNVVFERLRQQEALFSDYIGMNEDQITEKFGAPLKKYKKSPTYPLPYEADEMWRYEKELPPSKGKMYDFFFKKGIFIKVDVIG